MCTVSYFPTPAGFVLTANRDEDPGRETLPPSELTKKGKIILAPRDGLKGGTWVGLDQLGRVACLLNGAFDKHKRELPYRKSRGHFVFECLEALDFATFIKSVGLDGIEPFTLIMTEPGKLYKLVWDGTRKYSWELPAETMHLWSSATLYTPREHALKEKYLADSLRGKQPEEERMLHIHGIHAETPFVLDRPGVRTVSVTQIRVGGSESVMRYYQKNTSDEEAVLISTSSLPRERITG